MRFALHLPLLCAVLLATSAVAAERLYKYQDAEGNWVYTDRAPDAGREVETARLEHEPQPRLEVRRIVEHDAARLLVSNHYACPVEVEIGLTETDNAVSAEGSTVRLVIAAGAQLTALSIEPADAAAPFSFGYQYRYVIGRPGAEHTPPQPYRAPFAAAREFFIAQAAPGGATHHGAASRHAVDIAMPEGTAVYAARSGVVVDVAAGHFRGGLHVYAREANYVRILHADGSIAIYAHLRRDSIRVRSGERVRRGEYIADSGNTGFSSGPHLHFDVQVNAGLVLVSVPFEFEDGAGGGAPPVEGARLVAY